MAEVYATPSGLIGEIERNVLPALPAGTRLLGASKHGRSLWNQTYRVDTKLTDGQLSIYFLKVAAGPHARAMLYGEYESAKSLQSINPGCTATPITVDAWKSREDSHFILFEFIDMTMDVLNIYALSEMIANLHKNSMAQQSKFGFHVTTYHGLLPQKNDWVDTWEEFFVAAMQFSLQLEASVQGPNTELQKLSDTVLDRVIPRLLRPLETGAQKIRPCLVHGDLWRGNCSFDKKTKRPVVFDACAFWGHNEYDLGEWGPLRSNQEANHWSVYHSIISVSFPKEDLEDRICLYGIRFNLHDSALFPSNISFRNLVIEAMTYLVAKYASECGAV